MHATVMSRKTAAAAVFLALENGRSDMQSEAGAYAIPVREMFHRFLDLPLLFESLRKKKVSLKMIGLFLE